MPRKRYQAEEIIQTLREIEVLLPQGKRISESCRQNGVTGNTYYRWWKGFRGIRTDQTKCLKELDRENDRLKNLVAEAELDTAITISNIESMPVSRSLSASKLSVTCVESVTDTSPWRENRPNITSSDSARTGVG